MLVWVRGAGAASFFSHMHPSAQTLFDMPRRRSPNHVAVNSINFVTMITCDHLLFYFFIIIYLPHSVTSEGCRMCTFSPLAGGLTDSAQKRHGPLGGFFWCPGGKSRRHHWRCFYGTRNALDFGTLYENGRELGKREYGIPFFYFYFSAWKFCCIFFRGLFIPHCSLTDDAIKVGDELRRDEGHMVMECTRKLIGSYAIAYRFC